MMVGRRVSGSLALVVAGTLGVVTYGASAAAAPGVAAVAGWKIRTVAGGLGAGPARSLFIGNTCAVAFAGGHLHLTDGGLSDLVSSVSLRTGWLRTEAGTVGLPPPAGPAPDGTPALDATLSYLCGLAADHAGNLLVDDGALVRVVAARSGTFYGKPMKAGDIYTIAGQGISGFSGDGGPAVKAQLQGNAGLAVDAAGNVVVADTGNDRVRLIAAVSGMFYGQQMTAGDIYTIAGVGAGSLPPGNAGPATSAQLHIDPQSGNFFVPVVAADQHGNVVLADTGNGQVRVIAARSGRFYGRQMKAGYIYQAGGSGTDSGLYRPGGAAVDPAGNIVVSDTGHHMVKVIGARSGRFYGQQMTAGDTYTIAGPGPASGKLVWPQGVAVDSAGNVAVADSGGHENPQVKVVAAVSGRFYGVAMKTGHVYPVAGVSGILPGFPGNGTLAINAEDLGPGASDRYGNLVTTGYGRVLVVPPRSGRFYGMAMRAGRIYSVAGGGGHRATGGNLAASVHMYPTSVTTDRAGNFLVADPSFLRVAVVAQRRGRFYGQQMKAGRVYTIAGTGTGHFGPPGDGGLATRATVAPDQLAVDLHGNVVIHDVAVDMGRAGRIRVVAAVSGRFYGQQMKAGHIYAIAGSTDASSVAVDRSGNILFADFNAAQVDVVAAVSGRFYGQQMKAGHIYAIAGDGNYGSSGDGGPATQAGLAPDAAVTDAAGNVIIADTGYTTSTGFEDDGWVRVVALTSGTFYGQPMTAGDIYTIAGGGTAGLGDGGPALRARLYIPSAVAVEKSGAILVSDGYRIRLISR
jgi:hypothetical protein